jgi:uncharacterized membrane protein
MKEKPGTAELKSRSIDPASLFLIAGLLVGILYCIAIPYGAGFDEERHLTRIYYMSKYQFLPNVPHQTIHEEIFDLSYQRRFIQTPAFDMFSSEIFWMRFSKLDEDIRYGQRTQSIYSPLIFLPQAIIGRALWWKFDFPILPTIILQRIAGLLMYVAGAYAAIRALPWSKWILAALALSPAALFQASTLNADGFTNAVSFAFIGWVMSVYARERSSVQPRSVWVLVALSVLLGLAKPGAIILLPLLLILVRHPFPSRKWIIILAAGALLSVLANVGWAALATPGSGFSGSGSQSITRQLSTILADPFAFFSTLVEGAVFSLPYLIQGWVAAYGYWAGRVPNPVYFFSAALFLAALLAEPHPANLPAKTRIFLGALCLLCCAAVFGISLAANYTNEGIYAAARHGRYFIPFAPLFFIGVSGLVAVRENIQRLAGSIAIGSFLLVTGYFSFGIYAAYYTYCGYDAYVVGKCFLPIYKNLERDLAPDVSIHQGGVVNQTFTNFCGQFEMMQALVRSVPENSDGSLRFALLDVDHHILVSKDFPIRGIVVGDYLSLPADLPPVHARTNYEIQLEAVNLLPEEEIRLSVTPSDYYPGQLRVNGLETRGDLIIHYVCASP